jgi:hypothetical protein
MLLINGYPLRTTIKRKDKQIKTQAASIIRLQRLIRRLKERILILKQTKHKNE